MDEACLADAVAAAYEAATGGSSWIEFGAALRQLVGAQAASLRLLDGPRGNILQAESRIDAAYLDYYGTLDPYRARAAANVGVEPKFDQALLGPEVLPTDELHRSEYFNDYAAPNGQHHMMGALIGLAVPMPLGLHRDAAAGPFTDRERRLLQALLPHLRRALQLSNRLQTDAGAQVASLAALDALSVPVFIVDADMRVVYANPAATTLTTDPKAGLRMTRTGQGGVHLAARQREDSRMLQALVRSASVGGNGGATRVRAHPDEVSGLASLAVVVSPAPLRLATMRVEERPALAPGHALVVARSLTPPLALRPGMLSDLYGLTQAEAAVAVSLSGGVTAEEVARTRQVSLDTVRTQVRMVLRKTNAANLRDLERILALLAASL